MTKAARASPNASLPSWVLARARGRRGQILVRDNVENDVVGPLGVAGYAGNALELVEAETVADAPGDHVVRAGRIATDADTPHSQAATSADPCTYRSPSVRHGQSPP